MTDNLDQIVTIEIKHNSYRIYPYRWARYNKDEHKMIGTSPKLDKVFMKFDPHFRRYKLVMKIYSSKKKMLTIPIGIDLEFIKKKLDEDHVVYDIKDNSEEIIKARSATANLNPKMVIKDVYQARGITFLTSEKLFHTKLLALATGLGKTFCAIAAAYRKKTVALIISPTLSDQWVEKLEEYTNCNRENGGIVVIKGCKMIEKIIAGKAKPYIYKAAFYVSTPITLSNYEENGGSLNELGNILGIGIKCFDEYHQMFSANVYVDTHMDTAETFFLTATPLRSDYSERKIFSIITDKIPVYGFESFKKNDYYNLRLVNYNTMPSDYEKLKCFTSKGLSAIMYWNYIFESDWRMMYILGIVKYILDKLIKNNPDTKVLIYLAKIEHLELAKKWFEKIYNPQGINVGNYTSAVKKSEKRSEMENNIVFTTIGSGGTGLDTSGLQAIFSLVPFSSPITSNQTLGRLRPLENGEVYFYDFCDTGFEVMEAQREKRMSYIKNRIKTKNEKSFSWKEIREYI